MYNVLITYSPSIFISVNSCVSFFTSFSGIFFFLAFKLCGKLAHAYIFSKTTFPFSSIPSSESISTNSV